MAKFLCGTCVIAELAAKTGVSRSNGSLSAWGVKPVQNLSNGEVVNADFISVNGQRGGLLGTITGLAAPLQ